jgi:prophage regulatory protein
MIVRKGTSRPLKDGDRPGTEKTENEVNKQEDKTEDRALGGPRARRMLREDQVLQIIPISRSTLWRMEKAGTFPRSTYISSNRRIWFEDEILAWQNAVDEFNPNRGRGKGRRARVSA